MIIYAIWQVAVHPAIRWWAGSWKVAVELISEVFSVGGDEVKRMIKERMEREGMIWDRRKEQPENAREEMKIEPKRAATAAKKSSNT